MAKLVLANQTNDSRIQEKARLIIGKGAYETEDYESAIVQFDSIRNSNNEVGAEAKYLLARIYYLQGLYKESDTIIYTLVDQVPSSPYWIAKGFILLADNFISKGDYYNARITFQSVIDNAENKELVDIASEKLSILRQAEELDKNNEAAPIEIFLDEENVSNKSIFDIEE